MSITDCVVCSKVKEQWGNRGSRSKYCSPDCFEKSNNSFTHNASWFKSLNTRGECSICQQTFLAKELEVDHVKPFAMGGLSSSDNLQLLCTACHSEKTKGDMKDLKRYKLQRKFGIVRSVEIKKEATINWNPPPRKYRTGVREWFTKGGS